MDSYGVRKGADLDLGSPFGSGKRCGMRAVEAVGPYGCDGQAYLILAQTQRQSSF